MSRRRSLSDEESVLWAGVARSVTPLQRRRQTAGPPGQRVADGAAPVSEPASLPPAADSGFAPAKKAPPLVPLGRRLKQRVARGREQIDARLDLHGFTQAQAHAKLLFFLRQAQAGGAKMVLVVTGKGTARNERHLTTERGVLRRQVPMWLSLPEFRALVVGFEDAHAGHGGQGALYVRLRRAR